MIAMKHKILVILPWHSQLYYTRCDHFLKVQKNIADVPALAEETGKDNSDCPFGFGFVKE